MCGAACCGCQFDVLPFHWAVRALVQYEILPEAERSDRAELSDDFSSLTATLSSFVAVSRCRLWGIPRCLLGVPWFRFRRPAWKGESGLWAAVIVSSQDLSSAGSVGLYPISRIPWGLRTRVYFNARLLIPPIELEPTDHPPAIGQRGGISVEQAIAIAERLLPRH
jgi:hypothetical protein